MDVRFRMICGCPVDIKMQVTQGSMIMNVSNWGLSVVKYPNLMRKTDNKILTVLIPKGDNPY